MKEQDLWCSGICKILSRTSDRRTAQRCAGAAASLCICRVAALILFLSKVYFIIANVYKVFIDRSVLDKIGMIFLLSLPNNKVG